MKPPVHIKFTPEASKHQPLTRSMLGMHEAVLGDSRVQLGSFYAVLCDNSEGFVLAKCRDINPSEFVGLLLEKCSEDSLYFFYKQSDITEQFEMSSV